MFTRIVAAAAVGALLLGVAGHPARAQDSLHREFLTFSGPIALPGVVLAAGTYLFETPSSVNTPTVVRVRSRDGRQVYLTQFTRIVDRPNVADVPRVTFSEAGPGQARPINAWYPRGADAGKQFIYN